MRMLATTSAMKDAGLSLRAPFGAETAASLADAGKIDARYSERLLTGLSRSTP